MQRTCEPRQMRSSFILVATGWTASASNKSRCKHTSWTNWVQLGCIRGVGQWGASRSKSRSPLPRPCTTPCIQPPGKSDTEFVALLHLITSWIKDFGRYNREINKNLFSPLYGRFMISYRAPGTYAVLRIHSLGYTLLQSWFIWAFILRERSESK